MSDSSRPDVGFKPELGRLHWRSAIRRYSTLESRCVVGLRLRLTRATGCIDRALIQYGAQYGAGCDAAGWIGAYRGPCAGL